LNNTSKNMKAVMAVIMIFLAISVFAGIIMVFGNASPAVTDSSSQHSEGTDVSVSEKQGNKAVLLLRRNPLHSRITMKTGVKLHHLQQNLKAIPIHSQSRLPHLKLPPHQRQHLQLLLHRQQHHSLSRHLYHHR